MTYSPKFDTKDDIASQPQPREPRLGEVGYKGMFDKDRERVAENDRARSERAHELKMQKLKNEAIYRSTNQANDTNFKIDQLRRDIQWNEMNRR